MISLRKFGGNDRRIMCEKAANDMAETCKRIESKMLLLTQKLKNGGGDALMGTLGIKNHEKQDQGDIGKA